MLKYGDSMTTRFDKMCVLPPPYLTNISVNPSFLFDEHIMAESFDYTKPNTVRPEQNGRQFAVENVKSIFLNQNEWLKWDECYSNGPNNTRKWAIAQVLAWSLP